MKINHNSIASSIQDSNDKISLLLTIVDYEIKWSEVPNHKLEILSERCALVKKAIEDMFELLEEYEK